MRRATILLFFSLLLLTGCEITSDLFGTGMPCSYYNAPEDGFAIRISDSNVVLTVDDVYTLNVDQTWLNSQLQRVAISCAPNWTVEPAGILTVEADGRITTNGTGAVRVTAVVGGSGGTKSDWVAVAVVPVTTESEPNNGIPAADAIADGQTLYGINDYSGDVDWFRAEVPAGQSMQFTLKPSIDLTYGYWSYSYYGSVYDARGSYVIEANRTVTNTSDVAQSIFLRVQGSGVVPYAVTVNVF